VHDVEPRRGAKRCAEALRDPVPAHRPYASRATQIVHGRAEEIVGARLRIVVEDEHMQVMTPCEPLDQGQKYRHDALAAAAIDASRDDKGDIQDDSMTARMPNGTKNSSRALIREGDDR
jgi:hypothetical protein